MCDSGRALPITAFKVKGVGGGQYCAFRDLRDALDSLQEEMEASDFQYAYTIEPYETTEEELDSLPEFEGDYS